MPNHVTTEVRGPKGLIDAMCNEHGKIDFNQIIKMPDVIPSGNLNSHLVYWAHIAMGTDDGARALNGGMEHEDDPIKRIVGGAIVAAFKRREKSGPLTWNDEDIEKFFAHCRSLRETGYASWYDWSVDHWGTKWNAYETIRFAPDLVRFQTAWSCPLPIFIELAAKFPHAGFCFKWADEDVGYGCGAGWAENGRMNFREFKGGSPEAYEQSIALVRNGEVPGWLIRDSDGKLRKRSEILTEEPDGIPEIPNEA